MRQNSSRSCSRWESSSGVRLNSSLSSRYPNKFPIIAPLRKQISLLWTIYCLKGGEKSWNRTELTEIQKLIILSIFRPTAFQYFSSSIYGESWVLIESVWYKSQNYSGTDPHPTQFRAKKYKLDQRFIEKKDFLDMMQVKWKINLYLKKYLPTVPPIAAKILFVRVFSMKIYNYYLWRHNITFQ